jgi:hypothetical protein
MPSVPGVFIRQLSFRCYGMGLEATHINRTILFLVLAFVDSLQRCRCMYQAESSIRPEQMNN